MGDDSESQRVQEGVDDTIPDKPFFRPRYGRGFNKKRDFFEQTPSKQCAPDRTGQNGPYEHGPDSQRGSWKPLPGRGRGLSRGNASQNESPFMSSLPFPFPGRFPRSPGGHNVGMMSAWGYPGISPVGFGNGLFLEQFRYPGHQQAYQAPRFESTTTNGVDGNRKDTTDDHAKSASAQTQSEESYSGPLIVSSSGSASMMSTSTSLSVSVSSAKSAPSFKLRGDAPEFIPQAHRTGSRNPTPGSSPRPKAADSWAQVELWREKYDKSGRPQGW